MWDLVKALFSGKLKLRKVGEVGKEIWEVYGEEKVRQKMERRATRAFMGHLKTKHPEWTGPGIVSLDNDESYMIAIPDGTSPLVIFLAFFYAMRCAVKDSRCKHKGQSSA